MSKQIFSLEHFLDFCKSKDPEEYYNYYNCDICACAQYTKSFGMTYGEADIQSVKFGYLNHLASKHPHNFGELTSRIEQALVAYKHDRNIGRPNAFGRYEELENV